MEDTDQQNGDSKRLAVEPEKHVVSETFREQVGGFKKPTIIIGPRRTSKTKAPLFYKYSEINEQVPVTTEKRVLTENEKSEEPNEISSGKVTEVKPQTTKPKPEPVDCSYREPEWKGIPNMKYSIEELKSGVIEGTTDLTEKSYTLFGRLDSCDIVMAHPTVSRFHAVLQYRGQEDANNGRGFYIYDLGSTHGTFLNKNRIKPQIYVRVKVGHVLKLGCSTRLFILQGPPEDEEEESELTVTELKEKRRKEIEERERKAEEERLRQEMEEEKRRKAFEERGVDWGMGEDADEETDLSENPFAATTNEDLYIDDPKKTLRGWFEREGEELTYDVEQAEKGSFICKIVLPLDNGTGKDAVVEFTGRSKKEAVAQCALEACRYIDRQGLLRQSHHESRKRQTKNWEENDYYDSDEDNFLDRTGSIEQKREKRMRKMGKIKETVETYETLLAKHNDIVEKLQKTENRWSDLTQTSSESKKEDDDDVDALDAFMKNLQNKRPNKMEIKLCKQELAHLRSEEEKIRTLLNIAKPAYLPELKPVVIKPKSKKKEDKIKETEAEKETVNDESMEETQEEPNTSVNPIKTIGPTLPSKDDLKDIERKKKRSRQRVRHRETSDVSDSKPKDETDEYNNCVWTPPVGQTGDGRTSLNDKFGY